MFIFVRRDTQTTAQSYPCPYTPTQPRVCLETSVAKLVSSLAGWSRSWSKCLFIVNYLHTIRQGALLGRHLRDYLTSFMRCNQNFYCLVCTAAVECLEVCRASVEVGLRDKLFSMYVKQASPSNVTKLNFTKFTCQTISLHFYYYHIQNSF